MTVLAVCAQYEIALLVKASYESSGISCNIKYSDSTSGHVVYTDYPIVQSQWTGMDLAHLY
jgi:hypothetical protein